MRRNSSPLERRHYAPDVTLLCVRCESLHMMKKCQVKRLGGRDATGQAKFVKSLFGVAA